MRKRGAGDWADIAEITNRDPNIAFFLNNAGIIDRNTHGPAPINQRVLGVGQRQETIRQFAACGHFLEPLIKGFIGFVVFFVRQPFQRFGQDCA